MDDGGLSQFGDNIPKLIIIAACIIMSAYFSASETAFFSMNKIRMKALANEGNRRAERALKISENLDSLLSTLLVGNNLVNICASTVGTLLFIDLLGQDMGATVATIVITVVVLMFGEITPKSIAKNVPENFAMFSAGIISVLITVFKPINWLVSKWQDLMYRIVKKPEGRGVTEEELITLVEEAHNDGEIDSGESELIRNAIEFFDKEVDDILTSRVDVVAVDVKADQKEIRSQFAKGYTRLPVYDETIDNIIGILNQKDIGMLASSGSSVRDIMSEPIFVVPSLNISELLKLLQSRKSHIAVVLDEFGGTVGIVTLEDILEELVGEIWDEHDTVVEPFIRLGENKYRVSCGADLDDMFDLFGVDEETDVATVGGWVIEQFGRIPRVGEEFDYGDLHICVSKRAPRRLTEVIITKKQNSVQGDEA